MLSLSRAVPDRRGVHAVRDSHGHIVRHLDAESLLVISRPARRRDLDHTDVIERALLRIEVRILPPAREQRSANGVRVGGVGYVHGAADGGLATAIGTNLSSVGYRYIVDLLM